MKLSKFGEKFTQKSGILQLMDDLGQALTSDTPVNMLGGGNPANIPEVNQCFQQSFKKLEDDLLEGIGNYCTPQGDKKFIETLVEFFNDNYNWDISFENIALTNGSQNAFFYLFNLFAGKYTDGSDKKILLPLAPEYIGYSDVHTDGVHFVANKPVIENVSYKGRKGFFKYRVDFNSIEVDENIGAICCSRPTNPTGNVLTDNEIDKLLSLAQEVDIPLIIDNAYGLPFPNILFEEASLKYNKNVILCMSLSKVGLPGLRTGIIIADKKVVKAVSSLNAIINLSPTRIGATIATPLIKDGTMSYLSNKIISPYYQKKVLFAIDLIQKEFKDYPVLIHKPEGAIFLWIWFKDFPITTLELYKQLKQAGTIIIAGEYFFPGIDDVENYQHSKQCIRVSYAQDDKTLRKGISMIGEFVRKGYNLEK